MYYEVLSDTHERAWYDAHRESILRGGDGTSGSGEGDDGADHAPNVWRWFSATVFAGYGSGAGGFYTVYAAAFAEIDRAELGAVSPDEEAGGASMRSAPEFMGPEADIKAVRAFYGHWEGFGSRLNFAWCDKYDTREAENRWVRRKRVGS